MAECDKEGQPEHNARTRRRIMVGTTHARHMQQLGQNVLCQCISACKGIRRWQDRCHKKQAYSACHVSRGTLDSRASKAFEEKYKHLEVRSVWTPLHLISLNSLNVLWSPLMVWMYVQFFFFGRIHIFKSPHGSPSTFPVAFSLMKNSEISDFVLLKFWSTMLWNSVQIKKPVILRTDYRWGALLSEINTHLIRGGGHTWS